MRIVSFSLTVLAIVFCKVRVIYGGNLLVKTRGGRTFKDSFEGMTEKGVHNEEATARPTIAVSNLNPDLRDQIDLPGITNAAAAKPIHEHGEAANSTAELERGNATTVKPLSRKGSSPLIQEMHKKQLAPSTRDTTQYSVERQETIGAKPDVFSQYHNEQISAQLTEPQNKVEPETLPSPTETSSIKRTKAQQEVVKELEKRLSMKTAAKRIQRTSIEREAPQVTDQLKVEDVQLEITPEGEADKKEIPVNRISPLENVLNRLINFINRNKEYLPIWNYERGDPPCFWKIGKGVLVGMEDNQKLALVSLQYKTDESYRSLSEILFDFKPIEERKREIIGSRIFGPFIHLNCPTLLDDPQFKDLIEAVVSYYKQIEAEFESPLERVTLEKEDNPQGKIVLRFPPLNPEDTEHVFTIFDPSSAMADAIRAEGREVMKGGKWGIKPNRYSLLSDTDYELVLTDLKNQKITLPCHACPISKGRATSRMNLRMYLAIFGFPGFDFHPGRETMATSFSSFLYWNDFNREKLISLEKLLQDVKNISIGELKVTLFEGKPKDGLVDPKIRGIAFDKLPEGGGYLFVSGKNGIGVARVSLTGGAKAVPKVFHLSPYYDLFFTHACTPRPDAYECKIGDTKVSLKLGQQMQP